MAPRTVFFDLDDTLLDGMTATLAAWKHVCAEYAARVGAEPEALREAIRREATEFWRDESKVEKEWRTRLTDARELVVRNALASGGWDTSPARLIAEHYAAEHRARLRTFDDALDTLQAVRSAGLRLGLLTNGPRDLQRDKIARFALEAHFDVIVIEGEFGLGKPHPEVFEHALAATQTGPGEAWHVGDNLYADVGGARRAGIHAVWIHRERLELGAAPAAIPDRAIGNLAELREALGIG